MNIVLDDEYYLLGIYFKCEFDGAQMKYDKWHKESNLQSFEEVKNVRPLPHIPVAVNVLTNSEGYENKANPDTKHIWGTNKVGKLMHLNFGDHCDEDKVIEPKSSQHKSWYADTQESANYTTKGVVLEHCSRVMTLMQGEYELTFPPLNLLAQIIDEKSNSALSIGDKLKSLSMEDDGEDNEMKYQLTQISFNQLMPKYNKPENELTQEEKQYNQWHNEKAKNKNKPIKGFMVPIINTCVVVFSDKFYHGAEVTIVKPLKEFENGQNKEEEILGVAEAKIPGAAKGQPLPDLLPCALIHLDPNVANDGLYLIRVKFWEDDYKELNEKELPKSIKKSKMNFDVKKRTDIGEFQNVYTYELHEHLKFASSVGLLKKAYVCGDMVTLEELLICQFQDYLPTYEEYTNANTFYNEKNKLGMSSFLLSTQISKKVNALSSDFVTMDGIKLYGKPGEIFKTVAKTFIDDMEDEHIPPIMKSALLFNEAIAANNNAIKALEGSKLINKSNFNSKDFFKLAIKNQAWDSEFIKDIIEGQDNNKTFKGSVYRLSHSWAKGDLTQNGIAGLATATNIYKTLNEVDEYLEARDDLEITHKNMLKMAESYLKNVTILKRYNNKDRIEQLLESVKLFAEDNMLLSADDNSLSIKLYFQFNSTLESTATSFLNNNHSLNICSNLANLLEQNPDVYLQVDGHAGAIGTEEYNLEVSKTRANYVKDLILGGVSADKKAVINDRIVTRFFGSSQPFVAKEHNLACFNQNSSSEQRLCAISRRVEIRILSSDVWTHMPYSRFGSMKMEGLRQILEAKELAVKDAEDNLKDKVIAISMAMGLLTPIAPYVAVYMVADARLALLDSALYLVEDLLSGYAYKQMKSEALHRKNLNVIARINKKLLNDYKKLNEMLEIKLNNQEELNRHLKSEINHKELLKRFLQRAYSLNCLVEILACVTQKSSSTTNSESIHKRIAQFKVDKFIEKYVMSDDWQINVNNSNTLAETWLARHSFFENSSETGYAVRDYLAPGLIDDGVIKGQYFKGFGVHSALYHDKQDGLKNFSTDFDLSGQKINKEDIGLSIIWVYNNNSSKWVKYRPNEIKLGPFDRVKIQVILKKDKSTSYKSVFQSRLSYYSGMFFARNMGPSFNVLFRESLLANFSNIDLEIENYFKSQFGTQILTGDEKLIGMEFEPQYNFGVYEISGLKPIYCKNLRERFLDYFNVDYRDKFQDLNYYMLLDESLVLPHDKTNETVPVYSYKEVSEKQLKVSNMSITPTQDDTVYNYFKHCKINYGISGETYNGMLYDGQAMKKVTLRDIDLTGNDFISSSSADYADYVPLLLSGNLKIQAAIKLADEYHFFSDISKELTGFSWDKPISICVAIIADKISDEYKQMGLITDEVPMLLQLSEGRGGSNVDGPVYQAKMYSAEDVVNEVAFADSQLFKQGLNGFAEKIIANNRLKDAKQKLYVMEFKLNYIAPTGRRVESLRPFFKQINDDNLPGMRINLKSISQQAVNKTYSGLNFNSFVLRGSDKHYYHDSWPWMQAAKEASNNNANNYWQQLSVDDKKQYVKYWMTKQASIIIDPKPMASIMD